MATLRPVRPVPSRPHRPPRRPVAAAAVVLAVAVAGACGGEDDQAAPRETFTIAIPEEVDEVCEDRPGDLGTLAEQRDAEGNPVVGEGRGTEPPGVDLVRAEARLDAERLVVRWTTVGDPAAAPTPWFTLVQGSPGMLTSWGVRVDQDDEGRWRTSLLTNEPVDDPRGLIASEEVTTVLDAAPEVGPTGVEVAIPRGEIPPPATVAWLFGATSGEGDTTVFDDCSTLFGDASTDGTTASSTDDTALDGAPPGG